MFCCMGRIHWSLILSSFQLSLSPPAFFLENSNRKRKQSLSQNCFHIPNARTMLFCSQQNPQNFPNVSLPPDLDISYHNSSDLQSTEMSVLSGCRDKEELLFPNPILLSQEIKPFSGLHRFSDDRRNWTLSFIGFPRYRKYIMIEYDGKHETYISSLISWAAF